MSSKNRLTGSLPQDKYYTPRWCIQLLIDRIDFSKVNSFLEPCNGDGRISKEVEIAIRKVHNNTILLDACEIDYGVDYLTYDIHTGIISVNKLYDLIITNPPFSKSIEFLTKSLKEASTVCYLQRLNWLGSQERKEFWNNNTPDKIFVLSKRPQFMKEMGLKSGSDSTEYAWFIWDKLGIVNGKHIEIL
jgi:23S rRNA A1618 N6-methylase RlmF